MKELPNNAFMCFKRLEEIVLPSGLASLPSHCFAYCSNLRTITGIEHIETFGSRCFVGCESLDETTYPMKRNERLHQIESTISQQHRSIIESLTNATIEEILFDSSCENWSKESTEFTLSIERRNGLFFLIIVAEGNSFGYFFNERMKGPERKEKMSESFYISSLNGKVMKEITKE